MRHVPDCLRTAVALAGVLLLALPGRGQAEEVPEQAITPMETVVAAAPPASEPKPEEPARIKDNLFLLEEAYNQEPGVIQHISVFQYLTKSNAFGYSFTDEWPVGSDLHQLSLTLGFGRADGSSNVGVADTMINYRIQALGLGGEGIVAMAPRLSLIIPTGNYQDGMGRRVVGFQVGIPLSLELGRYFSAHFNLGATISPGVGVWGGPEGIAVDANAGAAIVFEPLSWMNALVEVAYNTTEDIGEAGRTRSHSLVVNPGLRFAIDVGSLQIVPGISVPMQVLEKEGFEVGVLGYLSFEHPF
ncbi:MAG: hypothetical protein QM765_10510 [Myxococcales bacterium]